MKRWLLAAAAFGALLAASQVIAGAEGSGGRGWPDGVVRYYDSTGMPRTVAIAAARWNASGADVHLVQVRFRRDADVIIERDDDTLRRLCEDDCLGYTTMIGRPRRGSTLVLLGSELGTDPRPLSVWVAAHELGHVLGLRHRTGNRCSLMSERAFESRCAPPLAPGEPAPGDLVCVPAPEDVRAAAEIYGGFPWRRDRRCL
jgi:hypothetical protein